LKSTNPRQLPELVHSRDVPAAQRAHAVTVAVGWHGDTEQAGRSKTMQQTMGLKQFVVNHVVVTVLAVGVVVSGVIGVAGLAATDGLPWTSGDEAQIAAPAQAGLSDQAVRYYAAKEALLEAQEARLFELAALTTPAERYSAAKEARFEAEELQRSAAMADAARLEAMRRYFEHKEQQFDALP
jgi:hypothetical protein